MIFRHEYRGGVWVDLEYPTPSEISQVVEEFDLADSIERELTGPTPRPLVRVAGTHVLLVIHFPIPGQKDGDTKNQEIDFVVGKNCIITVRYEIIAPIHHLKKLVEAQELVEGKTPITTDMLLEVLFAHLYTSMHDHTNHLFDNLSRVESDMFSGLEKNTVRATSNISRAFLHLEAALASHEEPIEHFFAALINLGFFGPSFPERSGRIIDERTHLTRIVKTHRAAATELRETNIALLESRQNEIMKTLTMITVVVLPLELIAFILDMHLPGTPLEDNPHAFFIVIGIMLSTTVCTFLFFVWKRWL